MKKIIILLLMIVVLVFSSCLLKTPLNQSNNTQPVNTKTAPDFTLLRLNGDKVTLSELKGKVVVINFYTTWCSYCQAELPGFIKVLDDFKGKNIEFLFVDVEEDKETAGSFIESKGYNEIKPLLDTDGSVSKVYSVRGFPTTYIIDSTGCIFSIHEGYMNDNELKSELNKIVK